MDRDILAHREQIKKEKKVKKKQGINHVIRGKLNREKI